MSFVIQASPLTKIFLHREWADKCIQNPELIYSDETFTVVVPRSMGAIVLTHGRPVAFQDVLSKQKNRKIEADETRDVIPWLTGGENGRMSQETDIYGIVSIDLGSSYTGLLTNMLMLEAAADKAPERKDQIIEHRAKLQAKALDETKRAIVDARNRADERVIRACKSTFTYLYRQYQRNIEDGKGKYEPSPSEALCAFVLRDMLAAASAKKRAMMGQVSGIMNEMVQH